LESLRWFKKSGEAADVFFGSFLDTKKELGCGAKPIATAFMEGKQDYKFSA